MNPTEAANAFFDALAEARWRDAADSIYPPDREPFQNAGLAQAIAWLEYQDMRQDNASLTGYGSDGVLSPEKLRERRSASVRGHFGASTLGDLAELVPSEYLARHFESVHASPVGSMYGLGAAGRIGLGYIEYGPTAAYVLYAGRLAVAAAQDALAPRLPYAEVLHLLQEDGRWWVRLNTELGITHLPLDDDMLNMLTDAANPEEPAA